MYSLYPSLRVKPSDIRLTWSFGFHLCALEGYARDHAAPGQGGQVGRLGRLHRVRPLGVSQVKQSATSWKLSGNTECDLLSLKQQKERVFPLLTILYILVFLYFSILHNSQMSFLLYFSMLLVFIALL